MSRARTVEELRAEFLDQLRVYVQYWAHTAPAKDCEERLSGLVFSILNIFDGTSALVAYGLVARPHPSDKEYHQGTGEDWIEDGTVINECHLHEMWYRQP